MTPFAIIGSQRSGTTYLRRSLNDHPDIVCHGEPFGPDGRGALVLPVPINRMPSKAERDADPIAYLDRMMSYHRSGFAGFKLLLAHSPVIQQEVAARGYRIIVLRRENALAKFSSSQILEAMPRTAERFLRPANEGPSAVKATFDAAAFEGYVGNERRRWETVGEILARHSPPRFDLDYEELVWGDGLQRVLAFLGAEQRLLDAGMEKLNSMDVVSRFANPDAVRAYLSARGLTRWEREGPAATGESGRSGEGKNSTTNLTNGTGRASGRARTGPESARS